MLDIAAGAGQQTLDIARRVGPTGQVLATDISPRILALARERLQRAGLHGVSTRVADAQALGLDGADFDAAVCRLGLMFCHQPLAALASVRSALRPGGRFGAVVFGAPAGNPCITILMQTALQHAGLPPPAPFAPGTLLSLGRPGAMADLLQAAGFTGIEVRAVQATMQLPSRQHYVDFVRSAGLPVMALLAPLPAAAQRAAWDDIAGQLDRFRQAGGWSGPNELLLCTAVRPAHGTAHGRAHDTAYGTVVGTAVGTVDGTSQDTPQHTADGRAQATPQGTLQGTPQDAT